RVRASPGSCRSSATCSGRRGSAGAPFTVKRMSRSHQMRELAAAGVRLLTALFLGPLHAYQRFVSPALPRRCKYEPTCSAYAEQAIRAHGFLRGFLLALWRLARCNPFSHGGYDPVPPASRGRLWARLTAWLVGAMVLSLLLAGGALARSPTQSADNFADATKLTGKLPIEV